MISNLSPHLEPN